MVVLIGDRAYKTKKPVTTDVLDFSAPEARERACEREVELNRRLAPDSYLGVARLDAVLKTRLVKDVSDKLDNALLTGGGASDSITGLIEQDGVQTDTRDPADPDSLLDAIGLAVAAEVMPNRWCVNGADFTALRKVKEASGSAKYVLESDLTRDATYRLFGIPVTVTNKLDEGTAVLADMSNVAIARDLAPSVTVLNERYAEYDLVGLRIATRYDLGLLHPEAVIVHTGAGS